MSFVERVNRSGWFRWSHQKMDDFYLISTRKFKVLKRLVVGEGKMMGIFKDIQTAWYAGDLRLIAAIRQEILTSPAQWIPHTYKQAELIAYCTFLLGIRGCNRFQRGRMLTDLRSCCDERHELGVRIVESAVSITAATSFARQSWSLVQPHQQR